MVEFSNKVSHAYSECHGCGLS